MSRSSNNQSVQNMQKDALIASLKKELYELQDREHDSIPLNNEVANIESKYSLLQDEKQRIQNEHKIKVQMNKKTIIDLRTESDSLKLQIHRCSVSIDQILRDVSGLKRVCENRDSQITALIGSNQQINSKNQHLSQQNRNQLNKIKTLRDDRNKMDQDCQMLLRNLEDNINLLKILQKQARTLEASNSKLDNILVGAQKDNQQLNEEMSSRQEVVNSTHKKLQSLNKEIENLKQKTIRLQKDTLKSQQDHKSVAQNLDLMTLKNLQTAKKIKVYESQLRLIENELDRSILDRDKLQNDHASFASQYNYLNEEIDKILLQVAHYQKLNNQLQKELQNYIISDQQARALLNRKEGMLNLLDTVSKRLNQTGQNISHLR